MVMLPEVFNSPYGTSHFPVFAEPIPGTIAELNPVEHPTTACLHNVAKECGTYLVGGTYPERDGACVYNTCVVFGPDGDFLAKYRKMHLFDIDIPGGITFKESDTLSPGSDIAVFGVCVCVGVAVCVCAWMCMCAAVCGCTCV